MALVATVNGIRVYSDKKCTGIINEKVIFADGSWCNTKRRTIENKGSGSISFDSPADEGIKIKKEFFLENAKGLTIRDVDADVSIIIVPGTLCSAQVRGFESRVKAIVCSCGENILTLKSERDDDNDGISITSINNSSISIGSGNIHIGTMNMSSSTHQENDTSIDVCIPRGMPVDISGVTGKVVIGNTRAFVRVRVRVKGNNSMAVGHIDGASLKSSGNGEISVSCCSGAVEVETRGNGTIEIHDGSMTLLDAKSRGNGDIICRGSAEDAILRSRGNGDIIVRHVENKPQIKERGNGTVRVKNW